MTFSIVARDAGTGEIGVAVQTCMFAVGSIVPWARAGVGAVASQASSESAYGPRCLDAMAGGATAAQALATARGQDPAAARRQVGVADSSGRAESFTRELCIDHAGHALGDGYAVQANIAASSDVWPAMAEADESSTGRLGERLLAALRAGQDAGGDARGQMAAAMIIVAATPAEHPWEGRLVDIRVDHDQRDPIGQLARLYRYANAFAGLHRGVDALMSGDPHRALDELEMSLALVPGEENLRFLEVGALLAAGRTREGLVQFRELVASRPTWAAIACSFAEKGLLPVTSGIDLDTTRT